MNYAKILKQPVPQSQPLSPAQVKNEAGGYVWPVDDWVRLERFLILGTEGGTYYASEEKLTKEMAGAASRCLDSDPMRVSGLLVDVARKNRAAKADPSLLVLALAVSHKRVAVRQFIALEALPEVVRTPYQLARFLNYITEFRGWGRLLKGVVARRFLEMDLGDLVYQAVKYKSRDGWSTRDMLRVGHPKTLDETRNALFNWMANKSSEDDILALPPNLSLITANHLVNKATDEREVVHLINQHRLTWEMIPTQWLRSQNVWEALLPHMPVTALVRKLGILTNIGLLSSLGDAQIVGYVVNKLRTQTRVHPFNVLNALRTYQSGHGDKGSLSWTPVPTIVDALTEAFYSGFQSVEPTGKRIVLGIDVSGSMKETMIISGFENKGGKLVAKQGNLTAYEGAAVMAMGVARGEKQYMTVAFDTNHYPLTISAAQRLDDVLRVIQGVGGGGTDCAIPMAYALMHKLPVDAFVILTDSQTWQGHQHPAVAIQKYREKMNIPRAKLVVMAMASNSHSIGDPGDAGVLNVVGFDGSAIKVIKDFISS